jgi:hypothetical protein
VGLYLLLRLRPLADSAVSVHSFRGAFGGRGAPKLQFV